MKHTSFLSLRFLRSFAHSHDDLPAFHAAYLVLVFLAAAMLNLGCFAVLVIGHMALDIFKYRDVHGLGWKRTFEGVVRENMLDIMLFFMALTISIYLSPSLAGFEVKGLILAELTVARGLGIMIPKLKILHEAVKVMTNVEYYLSQKHPRLGKRISLFEGVSIVSTAIMLLLLILAPVLLDIDTTQYTVIFMNELMPWKM